ncbi:hypothetical protein GA0115280_110011 [Streptomyces sp. Cmuel-A718b]|nr:hypothetical protein GA0115280_110011 [Streptomyces sp. Cmuel-A718b]
MTMRERSACADPARVVEQALLTALGRDREAVAGDGPGPRTEEGDAG